MDKAYGTACTLLHHVNCRNIHEAVYSHNTNTRSVINDENALMELNRIYDFLQIGNKPSFLLQSRYNQEESAYENGES